MLSTPRDGSTEMSTGCTERLNETSYLIQPNSSLSARQAVMLVVGLSGICLAIAAGLAITHGAWPIVPFAGLEVILIALGIWSVQRRSRDRELLVLGSDHVDLTRFSNGAVEKYRFERREFKYNLAAQVSRLSNSSLKIGVAGQYVEIGACLTDDERAELAESLSAWLPTAAHS